MEKQFKENTPQLSYEAFVDGITARDMDCFSLPGPRITLDTTDFSQVNTEALEAL